MSKVTEVKDLGNRYGNLGSALVRKDGRYFVISGTTRWEHTEWAVFPASRTGRVISWRDLTTRDTREQAVEALSEHCHCGSPMRGSDHCPFCFCEEGQGHCEERYDGQV